VIYLIIIVCLFWGTILGYIWFNILSKQTQRALNKSISVMQNPLRTFGAVVLMCAPLLLKFWDKYYGIYGIISSFAGFAIGSGVWWLVYIRKNKDGGR
jgi:hypothetical protein